MPRPNDLIGWRRLQELFSIDDSDLAFYDRLIGAASEMAERVTGRRLVHHRRTDQVGRRAAATPIVLGSYPVTEIVEVRDERGQQPPGWRLVDADAGLLDTHGGVAVVYEAGYGRRQRQSITCLPAAVLDGKGFELETPDGRSAIQFEHVGAVPQQPVGSTVSVAVEPGGSAEDVAAALASALSARPDLTATAAGAVVTMASLQVGAVAPAADVDAGVSVVVDTVGQDVPDDLAVAVAEWISWEAARLRSPAGVGVRTLSAPDGLNTALELDIPMSVASVLRRYRDRRV